MEQVRVLVQATDPISQAGLANYIECSPGLTLVSAVQRAEADVQVIAAERPSHHLVAELRRSAAEVTAPAVMIVNRITEFELINAAKCRVVAILPRITITPEKLSRSIAAAFRGDAEIPAKQVRMLLKYIEESQQNTGTSTGLSESVFTSREIDVLTLVAEGSTTREIAGRLSYSERTIKKGDS